MTIVTYKEDDHTVVEVAISGEGASEKLDTLEETANSDPELITEGTGATLVSVETVNHSATTGIQRIYQNKDLSDDGVTVIVVVLVVSAAFVVVVVAVFVHKKRKAAPRKQADLPTEQL